MNDDPIMEAQCEYRDYATGVQCTEIAERMVVNTGRCFECNKWTCLDHLVTCEMCDQAVCPHCYDKMHGEDNCTE